MTPIVGPISFHVFSFAPHLHSQHFLFWGFLFSPSPLSVVAVLVLAHCHPQGLSHFWCPPPSFPDFLKANLPTFFLAQYQSPLISFPPTFVLFPLLIISFPWPSLFESPLLLVCLVNRPCTRPFFFETQFLSQFFYTPPLSR